MITQVKNVSGSSRFDAPLGYSSWLEYWEKQSGKSAWSCAATDCHKFGRDNLVGAHVQKVNSTDQKWYIVPLCKSCNNRVGSFYADKELVPVPSNL